MHNSYKAAREVGMNSFTCVCTKPTRFFSLSPLRVIKKDCIYFIKPSIPFQIDLPEPVVYAVGVLEKIHGDPDRKFFKVLCEVDYQGLLKVFDEEDIFQQVLLGNVVAE